MKIRALLVSAVSLVVAAGIAVAAEQAAAPADKAAPVKAEKVKKVKPVKVNVKGMVEAVDAAAAKITVKTSKGEVKELAVAADAKIKRSGKVVTLAEVMVGDKVNTAKGEEVNGVPTVNKLDVKAPKAPKAAKAEKAEKK
jgi:hypothetical protein